MERLAKRIVKAIHADLNGRRGFDFGELDDDTYKELCADQADIVLQFLEKTKGTH